MYIIAVLKSPKNIKKKKNWAREYSIHNQKYSFTSNLLLNRKRRKIFSISNLLLNRKRRKIFGPRLLEIYECF